MSEYKMCANCVMDTTDPQIRFDEKGVCDHCNNFYKNILPNWKKGEEGLKELEKLAKKIKEEAKNKDFDCIIGLSGGIDSSYVAYVAKEVMGLRPLLFHVDAGWNSELAVHNIEVLVNGLGLDLFTEVIDWDEMRDLQLAFFKSGVPHIDVPQDHAFFATMYKFAEQYKIKYIITGANYSTESVINPLNWMYYQSDVAQLLDIHKKFGTRPLKKFPLTHILKHKFYLPYLKGIKVIKPLNFMEYRKKDAIDLLSKKYGWKPYPQKHFESRFTKFYEGFWLPKRFGYDVRKVQFSSLILSEQMTREEALEKLKLPILSEDEEINEFRYIADKLNIAEEELWGYFHLPKKSYKDYKNQRWLYELGANVMKVLRLDLHQRR